MAPAEVTVRRGDALHRVPVDAVAVGDTMVVRPGERVALDGEVLAGDSDVNQAPVTGESVPVAKSAGDRLFAGSINGHGALDARVTHFGRDSTIARIVDLVERAQAQRAPMQHFVDRFARYYTPAVLVFAAYMLNPLSFQLSPLALAVVFFYSYTKRFTYLSHAFLGLAISGAPLCAWIAVAGAL